MNWFHKYSPKKFDDFLTNKDSISNLRNFSKNLTHFKIYNESNAIGKRKIASLFIEELGIKNVFYINDALKTNESRDNLYSFLDKKINDKLKVIFIENLSFISNIFTHELINLLKIEQEQYIICAIDNTNSNQIFDKYFVKFKVDVPDKHEIIKIGEHILTTEQIEYTKNDINDIYDGSANYYDFIFKLESFYKYKKLLKFDETKINFEIFFDSKYSLLEKIREIRTYEMTLTQSKIVNKFFNYNFQNLNNIRFAGILGNAKEKYETNQNESSELYKAIARIHEEIIEKNLITN